MSDKPICGGNCNACHTCPDLVLSEDYMRGVRDGERIGRFMAEAEQNLERQTLAAHWKDQG